MCVFLVYLDEKAQMFLNPQRTLLFPGPLYQHGNDPTVYYADEDLTVKVDLFEAGKITEIIIIV